MFTTMDGVLEEIKERAKGSDKERIARLEAGQIEIKKRLSEIESKQRKDDE